MIITTTGGPLLLGLKIGWTLVMAVSTGPKQQMDKFLYLFVYK